MAGRVADTEEDRLVFTPGFGKGLLAPGKPIDRVVLVLEEVRRFLPRQAISVSRSGRRGRHIQIQF